MDLVMKVGYLLVEKKNQQAAGNLLEDLVG